MIRTTNGHRSPWHGYGKSEPGSVTRISLTSQPFFTIMNVPMLKKTALSFDLLCRVALHGAVLVLAVSLFYPVKTKAPLRMTQALWSGHDRTYVPPGSQFKIFKPYLHKIARVSLILDHPNNATTESKETSYDAQNYLAPRIINLETVEPVALVYCTSENIANERLAEAGYAWTEHIAPGKGTARKIR